MTQNEDFTNKLLEVAQDLGSKNGKLGFALGFVVLCFAVGAMYFHAWRKGKAVAKALHERDLARVKADVAKVDAAVQEHARARREAEDTARHALARVEDIDGRIEALRREHDDAKTKLAGIQSWDDVDRILSDRGPGDPPPAS